MVLKAATIILATIGLGTVWIGFLINGYNVGSCPAATTESGCDHTFVGTDIWIGATSELVMMVGLPVLASAGILLAVMYAKKFQTRSQPNKPS